jgi:hypothetical protein
MWFEENGTQTGKTYVSDGVLEILKDLEAKGTLPHGGGNLQFMDGNMAAKIVPILERAIACLSTDGIYPEDIFRASEGNAKNVLATLRDEAVKHPKAIVVAWR